MARFSFAASGRKLYRPGEGEAANESHPMTGDGGQERPVFISYATGDRRDALAICEAMERRGTRCWIACRDVPPGKNYQEEIVRQIRAARAMVLVFSDAANNSDEIKKELSLASRYHIPLMALRIEDVEPSDAFAYELSTRQWIDAFDGWDKSIDSLVGQLGQISGPDTLKSDATAAVSSRRRVPGRRRGLIAGAAIATLLLVVAAAWWLLRPAPVAAHSMMVRLTGFQNLSSNLPPTIADAVREEIIAAFGDQGVVGLSTAFGPLPGSAPAYALGGTIRREDNRIRVIIRLINEHSGATLWSNTGFFSSARLPSPLTSSG